MLSTSSYSKTIMKENLSRYWAISALGLLGFILVGMFPVILNYRRFNSVAGYASSVMQGSNFFIIAIIVVISIIASSAVFDYLHESVSAGSVHSMPVTRSGLFRASVLSGWIMTVVPIIVFGILMMSMKGAATEEAGAEQDVVSMIIGNAPASAKELFTIPHLLEFILTGTVVATFAYAVACLAAVLAGKRSIHLLLSGFLFMLPVLIVFQADALCKGFLYGFSGLGINERLLNAAGYAMSRTDFGIDAGYLLYYIAVSAALFVLALWVYKRIKLERIGNATTFPVVGDVLAAVLTVMCTLGFSQIVSWLSTDGLSARAARFAVVSIISSVVFYAIMRMIADSGFNIFNMKNLAKYGICLAVIAVVLAFTAFDITGFAGRVPDAADVAKVKLSTTFPRNEVTVNADFDDEEVIAALIDLQRAVVEEKDIEAKDDEASYYENFDIVWTLKNGIEKERRYSFEMNKRRPKTEAALRALYDTEAYRDKLHIDTRKEAAESSSVSVYCYDINADVENIIIRKEDYLPLFEAVDKDKTSVSFDEFFSDEEFSSIYVEVEYKKSPDGKSTESNGYTVRADKGHTLQFLESKGYIKRIKEAK